MIENNTCKVVHTERINIEMRKQGRKQDEGYREGEREREISLSFYCISHLLLHLERLRGARDSVCPCRV